MQLAIYLRFTLSLRGVEDLLPGHGVAVSLKRFGAGKPFRIE
jgi:transposase-like protein